MHVRGGRAPWAAAALGAAVLVCLAPSTALAQPAPPVFASASCPRLALKLVPVLRTARCGYLTVPENRSTDTGRTIRLAVAIVPARSSTPAPDPIVHLTGGPGGIALVEAQELVDAGFNRDRDLILMDQRGTLFSQPALTCPEIDRFNARAVGLPLDTPATRRLHVAATAACHRRLAAKGIDLGAYNTTENAADFADLRKALGIAEWNVFGVSYGTDLALTLMREHPEGIRTVTIDSVVPPNIVTLSGFWPNARDGFDDLFAACAAQRSCRRRHPGLKATFTRQVRRLEAHPVTTRVAPAPGARAVKVTLDGGALANTLVGTTLSTPALADVPDWIDALTTGHPAGAAAARAASVTAPGFVGYGLIYGVACSEWVPYEPASAILPAGRRAFPRYPASVLAEAPQFTYMTDDCRVWNVPAAPPEQRDVATGTVPTFVLGGTFDAVTSLRWDQIAAQPLSSSTFASFPGLGHFVIPESRCAQRVFASFLATPTAPDTACVKDLRPPPFR
jgi:pimeloyl-ACP methyl ester carboxylesterase